MQHFTEIEILIFSYITASLASLKLPIWVEPSSFRPFRLVDWQSWAHSRSSLYHVRSFDAAIFQGGAAPGRHDGVGIALSGPVFGVFLAAVRLGERLNILAIVGTAIVLIAAVLTMKYETSY
jgi:hypothetical protein